MKIENAVALVTGANRGIGLAFARQLLARGAGKVYAGVREPATFAEPGVHALRLDVTKPDDVAAAAALALLLTILIFGSGKWSLDSFMRKHEHTCWASRIDLVSPSDASFAAGVGKG